MATKTTLVGAPPACNSKTWDNILWNKAKKHVFRLQVRIAKATREEKKGKVKALQIILTHLFYAKCLAVKQVTSNRGKKTPGIDGETWQTSLQKIKSIRTVNS